MTDYDSLWFSVPLRNASVLRVKQELQRAAAQRLVACPEAGSATVARALLHRLEKKGVTKIDARERFVKEIAAEDDADFDYVADAEQLIRDGELEQWRRDFMPSFLPKIRGAALHEVCMIEDCV